MRKMSRVPVVVAAALCAVAIAPGAASAQDVDPPIPNCGPGQVPTPQAPCNPVHAWPKPAESSLQCAGEAAGGPHDCPDATVSAFGSPVTTVHTGAVDTVGNNYNSTVQPVVYAANDALPCVYFFFGCIVGSD